MQTANHPFASRHFSEEIERGDTQPGKVGLFNMKIDPFERINRANGKPEKVKETAERMKAMAVEVGDGDGKGCCR